MFPVYFGSSGRRLFGLYSPAERKRSPSRAVVLCHPWGREYEHVHRSVRMLGSMLSTAGFDVLRFDYYGSGDAAGEAHEATLAGWEGDILAAVEEIKDTTGAARVALAGVRLGASLAAAAAVRTRTAVQELVLWDPVVSGADYLEELWSEVPDPGMRTWHLLARPAETGGGHEVQGYPLTGALEHEIRALNLVDLVPSLPARTLCVTSVEHPSYPALRTAFAGRAGGALTVENIPSAPAWIEQEFFGAGVVPVQLLHRIKEWLG